MGIFHVIHMHFDAWWIRTAYLFHDGFLKVVAFSMINRFSFVDYP